MKKILFLLLSFLLMVSQVRAQDDSEGSKDPVLFSRLPGYYISSYDERDFDKFEFALGNDKTVTHEGHRTSVVYQIKDDASQKFSPVQIVRNYSNAAKKIGGQIIAEYEYGGTWWTILKIAKGNKETWTQVEGNGDTYAVEIIEKEIMNQDVVADASSMSNSLRQTGKVALYGIYFDTGKSSLKAESQPSLAEIGKLMKAEPGLKLYVVGHTDNVGTYDANMKLSMDRAAAVVNALVTQHSVNAANLKACGNGPTAPVATNDTDAGKALNRRVELVKQ